jgi:RNA polymerase sigma factor (sigma-70 family)
MRRAAAGEQKAWETLVEQYQRLVWGVLGKFDNVSREEKEDLFQDVFLVLLHRGLQSFRGSTEYEFRSYLRIITENEAKSYLRRHSRRFEISDPFFSPPEQEEESRSHGLFLTDPSPGPEELVAGQEELRGLHLCLQDIPAVDQEIFWLRERDHPYKEIAQLLKLPQGTVASKYDRAKKKIEECLRKAGIL